MFPKGMLNCQAEVSKMLLNTCFTVGHTACPVNKGFRLLPTYIILLNELRQRHRGLGGAWCCQINARTRSGTQNVIFGN